MRRGLFVVVGLAIALAGCGNAPGPGERFGVSSSAITFANDEPAFDYFLGKGLTPAQAAGIVGNLDQESGVDPTSVQSGGPGRGIAQWSVGGRWDTDANDNATWYANMQGQSLTSLQLQLDFIWYELTTFSGYGLAELKQATNVTSATVAFETKFEGCGTCDQSQRVSYAENVLAAFGSDSPDATSPGDAGSPGVDSGTPCVVTTTGESGECMDTAACAALGNHESTPGFCPGPDNIQCCTALPGMPTEDAGAPMMPMTDAGMEPEPPQGSDSGSPSIPMPDAGTPRTVVDAASPSTRPDGAPGGEEAADGGTLTIGDSGGCAMTPSGASASGGGWLIGLAWVAARRRRRHRSSGAEVGAII